MRLVPESIPGNHLDEDLVPGSHHPRLVLFRGADDGNVARRRIRRRRFHLEVELTPGEREHRLAEHPPHANALDGFHRRRPRRARIRVGFRGVFILEPVVLEPVLVPGRDGLFVDEHPEGVQPRDGSRVSQLARAVAEFERLAGDVSGAGARAVKRRQTLASRHAIAESIRARHRERQLVPRDPPTVKRALDATLGVIHAPGLAHGTERGGFRADEEGDFVRSGFFDDVRRLVGAVAAILHASSMRLPPHAHRHADDGAALEQSISSRVARFDEDGGALARRGAGESLSRESTHRQAHLLRVNLHDERAAHHGFAVDGGDNLVPSHLPPSHGGAISRPALGERRAERVRRARRGDEVHRHSLLSAHAATGDVVLERLQVHVPRRPARRSLRQSRSRTNRAVRRLQRAVRRDHLHRGFLRDATVHRGLHHPSSRGGSDERAPVRTVAVVHHVNRARPRPRRTLQHQIHLVSAPVAIIPKLIFRLHQHQRWGAAKHPG